MRVFLLSLVCCANLLFAASPDPVRFTWVVERGNIAQVTQWFEEGLDPEYQGSHIGTGLMIAAWSGNIEMMQLFIDKGANPRRANKNGEQPLQLAAWNGHSKAVEWLLSKGAPLNREGNYWGALHYAAFNGHMGLVKNLVSKGANLNARSPNLSTPLMIAAREGREDIAKFLIESGASTEAQNDWGDTALTMALRYDHYRLGKMVATPEAFDLAIKAPKESYGDPSRSSLPPAKVEGLLKDIFEAEAQGKSATELKRELDRETTHFRTTVSAADSRRPLPIAQGPHAVTVVAKRGSTGERAHITEGKPTKGSLIITPSDDKARQEEIARLSKAIQAAKKEGKATDTLQQELDRLLGYR